MTMPAGTGSGRTSAVRVCTCIFTGEPWAKRVISVSKTALFKNSFD
ncbi:hypothetical protein AWT69_002350 [Pseudomonas putida]|nr:hypothetical protein AWT69_002350 [Pseudomonas putida]